MFMTKNKKVIFKSLRWLHIYFSSALFVLLVFFCVTGITLNHRWYGSEHNTETLSETALSLQQLEAWEFYGDPWQPKVDQLLDYLKQNHGLRNSKSIDLDEAAKEVVIEYRVPAGFASAIFSAEEKILYLEQEKGSTLGILNDLHKGRHSGKVWFWLIDISAVFMILFGVSGALLLIYGKKHRRGASLAMLAGLVSPWALYLIFVPSVGGS